MAGGRRADAGRGLHTWSLAIEVHFYVLWALGLWAALRAGWSRRRLFAAAACVVVVLAVVRAVVFAVGAGTHHELYLYTWSRIDAPLVGALAGISVAAGWLRRPPRWLVPAGAVALGVYVAFAFATPWDLGALPAGLYTGLAAVGAVTVVAVVTVPGSRLARALAWRPLVGLGVLSYSVYIWHYPPLPVLPPAQAAGPAGRRPRHRHRPARGVPVVRRGRAAFLRRRVRHRPRHLAIAGHGDPP